MSEWQTWEGKHDHPAPLTATDRVFLRYRDGSESKIRIVGDLNWKHRDVADDIMAYRFSHTAREVERQ